MGNLEDQHDIEERRFNIERFTTAALYWNSLANQRYFELNKQLLSLASILLPLTASIALVKPSPLNNVLRSLLVVGWGSLFTSILFGLFQIWKDTNYFAYLMADSSLREKFWCNPQMSNAEKEKAVDVLGETKSRGNIYPLFLQILFLLIGLLFIMIAAILLLYR